jgi:hypothetical protein
MPLIESGWLPESKVRIGDKALWFKARKYALSRLGDSANPIQVRHLARKVYILWGGKFLPKHKTRVMHHKRGFAHYGVFD